MPIVIKTPEQIDQMRRAGQRVAAIVEMMRRAVEPGVTTGSLEEIATAELRRVGAISSTKNYPTYRPGEGFPACACISVNDEIVHGVPGARRLVEGDIVTLDLSASLNGYCASRAITVPVGEVRPQVMRMVDVAAETLELAIFMVVPGRNWSEIAPIMQENVEKNGFSVIREFVGHGIGRRNMEDPKVSNFGSREQLRGDFRLRPGMTITIEPMVLMGRRDVVLQEDRWTVVSQDGLPNAHFRHTIAVTEDGADVLTLIKQA